ncbi:MULTISPECIES: acyl-CoA dehydrogenase family protein [Pseudomonadaceae]|uniref:acyl-CoA dehydrogenase family protein n=1 Tax=Pseudomonadaceae TaxID=135621 RepID=UPI000CFB13E3|nr:MULTISPECIES: acyl-CoA dehydrogenase family protein [Pseudomonadaceae]PRB84013.1 acyl-CoA dehydrogenase [Pseudomonas sp. MYb185]WGK60925.1 acyl-CoA dehydrogenase family protein [Halopseudomonas sp. SMJS2]
MSLVYNEDQLQLQDSARDFLSARSPVSVQRAIRDQGIAAGYDADVWQGMLELGWSAVAFSEEDGGLDFGFAGFAPLFEEMGRHLSASPLLGSVVLCGGLIEQLGTAGQRQQWLPQLISGELRLALALEESARHAPEDIALSAQADADGWLLDGEKLWVADAREADGWLVVAREADGGCGVFLVRAGTPGVQLEARQMIDARNMAALRLHKVRLEPDSRLGSADAAEALDLVLDRGRSCLAAELLGMAETAFQMTIEYLKTRVQFGVPIGSFQALQHRAARLYTDLQLARSSVMGAFAQLDRPGSDDRERRRLVSLAKWKAGQMAQRVSNEAIQMHGGIGVTDEYDLGLFLKRMRVAQNQLGNSDYHCQRYSDNRSA